MQKRRAFEGLVALLGLLLVKFIFFLNLGLLAHCGGGIYIFFFEKNHATSLFLKDKSRNLPKIVLVRLSASIERFFVSRMRDFYCYVWHLKIYILAFYSVKFVLAPTLVLQVCFWGPMTIFNAALNKRIILKIYEPAPVLLEQSRLQFLL